MEGRDGQGALASFAMALLTVACMAIGVAIMTAMNVNSGMGVASASAETIRAARPLLIAAELMKIVTAAALFVAVRSTARRWDASRLTSGIGHAAAALLLGAGLLGVVAVLELSGSSAELGAAVGLLGLLSLPVTGAWAAMIASGAAAQVRAGRFLRIIGILLGIAGFATFAFPPIGLLFGLVSLLWWVSLGMVLRRPAA